MQPLQWRVPQRRRRSAIASDEYVYRSHTTPSATRPGGGFPMDPEQARLYIEKHDKNGDGKLDLDEFSKAIASAAQLRDAAERAKELADNAENLAEVDVAGASKMDGWEHMNWG